MGLIIYINHPRLKYIERRVIGSIGAIFYENFHGWGFDKPIRRKLLTKERPMFENKCLLNAPSSHFFVFQTRLLVPAKDYAGMTWWRAVLQ